MRSCAVLSDFSLRSATGSGGVTAACDFSRVMSSLASRSSCCTRLCACLSSGALSRLSMTGNGLEARRFWSVLPPPSRFACARASALSGFVADLGVDEHDVEHVVGRGHPARVGHLEAQPHDGEGMEGDRGHERHLHRGDEPEPLQEVVGEVDERVGGSLPQLHRQARGRSIGRNMSPNDSSAYPDPGLPA